MYKPDSMPTQMNASWDTKLSIHENIMDVTAAEKDDTDI